MGTSEHFVSGISIFPCAKTFMDTGSGVCLFITKPKGKNCLTLFFSKTLKTTITRRKQQKGKKQLNHSTFENFSNPLVAHLSVSLVPRLFSYIVMS
jgi:hypothetical protein